MGEAAQSDAPAQLHTSASACVRTDHSALSPDQRLIEFARINAAVCEVRRRYAGAVADTLIDALVWHQSTSGRVSPTSLPARLVAELLRDPW